MKKLISIIGVLLSLLAGPSWAVEPINLALAPAILGGAGAGVAGVSYCTGAATCTATTPGECDKLCEDHEGSSNCDADNTPDRGAYCRNGWALTDAYSSLTYAAHSGTFGCTDKGSYAATATVAATYKGGVTVLSVQSDSDTAYGQFYFNVVSHTSSNADTIVYFGLSSGAGTSGDRMGCYVRSDGTNLALYCGYTNNSRTYVEEGSNPAINTNTWYRLRLRWVRNSAGGAVAKLNDDTIMTASGSTYNSANGNISWSSGASGATSLRFVVQVDNIVRDSNAEPGTCNQ